MALYAGRDRPYHSLMNKTQIDFSMPSISATFDLCGDNVYEDVLEISRASEVCPHFIRKIEDAPNGCAQAEVGFYTNEDAIAFTAVYLDEKPDSVYVAEYLGFDWKETVEA